MREVTATPALNFCVFPKVRYLRQLRQRTSWKTINSDIGLKYCSQASMNITRASPGSGLEHSGGGNRQEYALNTTVTDFPPIHTSLLTRQHSFHQRIWLSVVVICITMTFFMEIPSNQKYSEPRKTRPWTCIRGPKVPKSENKLKGSVPRPRRPA